MLTRRTSPLGELVTLRQAMDRLFEDSFVRPGRWVGAGEGGYLPLDVSTTPEALVVEAALPGFRPEDVEITIEQGTLTIRAESRSDTREEKGDYLVQEIRRGELTRSVTLPSGIQADKATAGFEHGVLTLRIPRAEEVKPRRISISATSDGQPASQAPSSNKVGAGSTGES